MYGNSCFESILLFPLNKEKVPLNLQADLQLCGGRVTFRFDMRSLGLCTAQGRASARPWLPWGLGWGGGRTSGGRRRRVKAWQEDHAEEEDVGSEEEESAPPRYETLLPLAPQWENVPMPPGPPTPGLARG